MCLHVHQSSSPRDGGVIRRLLIQSDAQELPQPQGVARPPGDATFRIDSLEVSDQQPVTAQEDRIVLHAQRGKRMGRERRPAIVLRVEASAFALSELIEVLLIQQFVQTLIERMAGAGGQFRMSNPEPLLAPPVFACAHGHRNILKPFCFCGQMITGTLTTGS